MKLVEQDRNDAAPISGEIQRGAGPRFGGLQTDGKQCGTLFCAARKPWEIQRGTLFGGDPMGLAPWLWVSNRGEKQPCWHTILLARSSVLYLL